MSDCRSRGPAGIERRSFGRRSVVRHAWIVVAQRGRLPCCIRNVAPGGALLELDVPVWLPYGFELIVEDLGIAIPCEVKHRGQHGVGVTFLDRDAAKALVDEALVDTTATRPAAPLVQSAAVPGIPYALEMRGVRI